MAKVVVHEIVSNVDTIIILKNPSVHFAPWKEDQDLMAEREDDQWGWPKFTSSAVGASTKKGKKKGKKGKMSYEAPPPSPPTEHLYPEDVETGVLMNPGIQDDILQSNHEGPSTLDTEPGESSKSMEQSIFGGGPSRSVPENGTIDEPKPGTKCQAETQSETQMDTQLTGVVQVPAEVQSVEEGPVEKEGIHFHVCSGNLMSASSWFNRVLKKDGWNESNRNGEDKRFHIDAEDWDVEAFMVLMNIFHLRNREVPRTVSLEMMAKIAVLVDYYECAESIELFTEMWVAKLRTDVPIPTTYNRTLVLWIWIARVFKLKDLFERSTRVAIEQCTKSVQTLGLPIPDWISEEIDLRRYQAIEGIMSGLHELLDMYRSSAYVCRENDTYSFQCGCMLLGALTKGMMAANVLSPRPEVPFDGKSFHNMCSLIKTISSPEWYDMSADRYGYRNHPHECSLETSIGEMVKTIVTSTTGLGLRVEAR